MNWIQREIERAASGETDELDLSTSFTPGRGGDSDHPVEFPPEILEMEHLTSLDLSFHKLREIPKELERLTKLKKLNLSFNKDIALPKRFKGLPKLEELNLSSCGIEETDWLLVHIKIGNSSSDG